MTKLTLEQARGHVVAMSQDEADVSVPDREALCVLLQPIPMVLHCPKCGRQHIDRATAEWDNPPHRSHACQNPDCDCIWRPADVPTTGVEWVLTKGKADNWQLGQPTVADRPYLPSLAMAIADEVVRRLHRPGRLKGAERYGPRDA